MTNLVSQILTISSSAPVIKTVLYLNNSFKIIKLTAASCSFLISTNLPQIYKAALPSSVPTIISLYISAPYNADEYTRAVIV